VVPLPAEDRRRPYRLTAAGSAALAERLDEMARFVRVGRGRLRQPDRGTP
jgi:DNA-binding PadR family transcriptional regulator